MGTLLAPDKMGQQRCSSCQVNYASGSPHVPDSPECVEMAYEKRWSQHN